MIEKIYALTDSDRRYIMSHPEDMRTIYGMMERLKPMAEDEIRIDERKVA
jgi:hypothetical protein